jgi:sec-independent protein translocase protein TatA
MPSLGPAEILVVLVIALLVFGPNKMPEIARQVGKGMREFKRVQQHLKSELRDVVSEFDTPADAPTVGIDPVPMLPPKDEPIVPTVTPPDPAVLGTADGHAGVDPSATMIPLGGSDAGAAASPPAAPRAAAPRAAAAEPAGSEPGAPADPA